MKQNALVLIFGSHLFLSGCGTGTWVAEIGGNDLAVNGLSSAVFSDGCSLTIDAMPWVVHEVSVRNASGYIYGLSTISNTVFDTANPNSSTIWTTDLAALLYTQQDIKVAPGIATVLDDGMETTLGKEFDSNNGSLGLYGTLSCGDNSVGLRWVFSNSITFYCGTKLKLAADTESVTRFEVDPSQWFRQSALGAEAGSILGKAVVNADLDGNGLVSLYELSEISLSSLPDYEDDPLDRVETLYQHIETNSQRLLQVNGTVCDVDT
jgi:hypothetical protein